MPIPTDSERIGTTIDGKYRVESLLGKGGMGTVFRAVHAWTRRPVALKVLQPQYAENDAVVLRFLREARAAASFRHPNVVEVLDMGPLPEGGAYMALAFLDGEPLSNLLDRRKTLTIEEALTSLVPVMRAIAIAHQRGIVHRDIKPDNLFLARNDDAAVVPTLLDFGIAKVPSDSVRSTTTGVIFGTPQYMSPEQARGLSDIDGRADQWSFAAVWFECLTGAPPFEGAVPTAIIGRILSETPRPLASVRPDVPAGFAAVIDRALSPDRAARFATMDEFIAALIAAASDAGVHVDPNLTVAPRIADAPERTDHHRAVESAATIAATSESFSAERLSENPQSIAARRSPRALVLSVVALSSVVAVALAASRPPPNQATTRGQPAAIVAEDAANRDPSTAPLIVAPLAAASDAGTATREATQNLPDAALPSSARSSRVATGPRSAGHSAETVAAHRTAPRADAGRAHAAHADAPQSSTQTIGVSATW